MLAPRRGRVARRVDLINVARTGGLKLTLDSARTRLRKAQELPATPS